MCVVCVVSHCEHNALKCDICFFLPSSGPPFLPLRFQSESFVEDSETPKPVR